MTALYFPEAVFERTMHEALRMKPKLQWQDVRVTKDLKNLNENP
jgi:hypothetical protein